MANVQPDKYVRISTDFFEALCRTKINRESRQVLDFIIRMTWGYNRKSVEIKMETFIEGTFLKRQAVKRAISRLRSDNMVKTSKTSRTGALTYEIQKDFDMWFPDEEKKPAKQENEQRSEYVPISTDEYEVYRSMFRDKNKLKTHLINARGIPEKEAESTVERILQLEQV